MLNNGSDDDINKLSWSGDGIILSRYSSNNTQLEDAKLQDAVLRTTAACVRAEGGERAWCKAGVGTATAAAPVPAAEQRKAGGCRGCVKPV